MASRQRNGSVKKGISEVEMRFAERLKSVRTALHWSAQELSKQSGVTRVAISKIENGDRGVPLGDAVALSRAIGVPLADMVQPGDFFVRATIQFQVDE
jgi:transcriptional regulator with XRE-family HTH domain